MSTPSPVTPSPAGPSPAGPTSHRVSSAVQGTVADFDTASTTGSVLLDDGRAVDFDAAAFAAGGLRLLRFGQRVRLDYGDDGVTVVRVTIHTLG